MRTSTKESAPTFASNLQKESPGNRVLLEMFSKVVSPDYLQFWSMPNNGEGLRVTSQIEGYIPDNPLKARGLEWTHLGASYDGKLLVVDTTPWSIKEQRSSVFKKVSHPDVVFWAKLAGEQEDVIHYGRGEFAGTGGLWIPMQDGSKAVEVDPRYCNYVAHRAFSFFVDELKSASQRELGARLVVLEQVSSVEPPSDLYNIN